MNSPVHFATLSTSKSVCNCEIGKDHPALAHSFFPRQHFVIVDNDDDGYPIKRACVCPIGRDHFADEPIEPAARQGVTQDFAQRYRDDATICLKTRFGQEHPPHLYSYIHPEGNGVGMYECCGLDALGAGHPYPKRPSAKTGQMLEDLIDDLVEWWHTYGTSELFLDRPLPMALDAAARVFMLHAHERIAAKVRFEVDEERRREYENRVEPLSPESSKVGTEFYLEAEGAQEASDGS